MNAKRTTEVGVFTGCCFLVTALNIVDDGKIVAIDKQVDKTLWGGTVAKPGKYVPLPKREWRKASIEFNKSLATDVLIELSHVPSGGVAAIVAGLERGWFVTSTKLEQGAKCYKTAAAKPNLAIKDLKLLPLQNPMTQASSLSWGAKHPINLCML
ncbi:hypothetical protein Vadar_025755 [Vaccinium darrowii]|uniref:Uncharacterized protein n=1 Tax=Vaccinium darrowii TaxID=229202 RepID=A0ACB7YGH9_9ERIC|nr:hypothetical protein Vadar_025755 [Vaccinium darrowii]